MKYAFIICMLPSLMLKAQDTVDYRMLKYERVQEYPSAINTLNGIPFSGISKIRSETHAGFLPYVEYVPYRDGTKNGIAKASSKDSVLTLGEWKNGKQNGHWKSYSPFGFLVEEINYTDGIRHGKWITYSNHGSEQTTTVKLSEAEFVNDLLEGNKVSWHSNGTAIENITNYINSKAQGESASYNADGTVREKTYYKDGKKDGPYTLWYGNGNISISGQFADGHGQGSWSYYYPSGQKWKETKIEGGKEVSVQDFSPMRYQHKGDTVFFIFPEFTASMPGFESGFSYDPEKQFRKDTITLSLEMGEQLFGAELLIRKSALAEILVQQRCAQSLSISDEGPHLDLIEWKKQYSEAQAAERISETEYRLLSYQAMEWMAAPVILYFDFWSEVNRQGGERWTKMLDYSMWKPGSMPWSPSHLYLSLSGKNSKGVLVQKVIEIIIPMGC